MTTASILPYAIGASTAFLAALGYATMLVAWWNRLPTATRTAYPRIGHYVVIVARLLPVAQGIGTAIHGMLTGAPVVSLPTVAPTPVQASRPSMVPPLAVLAAARMALCALVLVVTVLALGCSGVQVPADGGAPAPSWVPGAVVSLTIADGALQAAEATESATGLTGTDLADYDSTLRLCDSADVMCLGHIQNGASACQLHADAASLVGDFDQIAAICSRHGTSVPASVLTGAGRLVSVLSSVLPVCVADGGVSTAATGLASLSNADLAAHVRATFAGYTLPVPAHATDRQ